MAECFGLKPAGKPNIIHTYNGRMRIDVIICIIIKTDIPNRNSTSVVKGNTISTGSTFILPYYAILALTKIFPNPLQGYLFQYCTLEIHMICGKTIIV
jgi:hypothetical protein